MKRTFLCMILLVSLVFPALCASADDGDEETNLALGKPYTVKSDIANSRSYAERDVDDGVKLTDGKYGRNSWSDTAWVKYYRATGRTVTIDLGKICEIDRVKTRFISDNPAGCLMPEEVTVFVSSDGVNFSKAEILSGNISPYGHDKKKSCEIIPYDMPVTPVCGRYVAVHFDVTVNTFIDEIEVFGKENTSLVPPTDYTPIIPEPKNSYLDREALGGDHDIILFHTGYYPSDESLVNNKKETFLPFIAYYDQKGKIVDTMFDSVMFLIIQGLCPSGGGLGITGTPTVLSDWQMLLDMYFSDTYNLRALNDAAEEVKNTLGLENYKVSVYLTCPYPKTGSTVFGDYNGDGIDEKISTYDDCLSVCEWFVDECIRRFEEGNYSNLVLKGFFNNSEGLSGERFEYEKKYAKDMCTLLHGKGLYSVMIPYYQGEGIENHEDYGFDAVLMQPNVSFDAGLQDDPAGTMADFDETARQLGLGIEMEVNSSIIWDYDAYADFYIEYLHSASNSGLMTDTIHAYYNGAGDAVFGRAAKSSDKGLRFLYDATYKFIKNTLSLPDDPFTDDATLELEVNSSSKEQGATGLAGDWVASLNIKTRPKHGWLSFASDTKTFTYTAKDYVGEDGFEYDITSNGVTVTRKVKVNVVAKSEESEEASEENASSLSEEASEVKTSKVKKTFPALGYAVIGAIAAAVIGVVIYMKKKK